MVTALRFGGKLNIRSATYPCRGESAEGETRPWRICRCYAMCAERTSGTAGTADLMQNAARILHNVSEYRKFFGAAGVEKFG